MTVVLCGFFAWSNLCCKHEGAGDLPEDDSRGVTVVKSTFCYYCHWKVGSRAQTRHAPEIFWITTLGMPLWMTVTGSGGLVGLLLCPRMHRLTATLSIRFLIVLFFFFWLRLNCLRFPLRPFHIGYDYRDMASLVSVAVSIGAGSVWLNNPDNCPNFQYAVLRSSWSKFSCFLLQCTCDGRWHRSHRECEYGSH